MFAEECPYKVVRTNGGDEVLARSANLLIGKAAFETAKRMYPKDLIEYGPELSSATLGRLPVIASPPPSRVAGGGGGVVAAHCQCAAATWAEAASSVARVASQSWRPSGAPRRLRAFPEIEPAHGLASAVHHAVALAALGDDPGGREVASHARHQGPILAAADHMGIE
jgi:hypothetical protein